MMMISIGAPVSAFDLLLASSLPWQPSALRLDNCKKICSRIWIGCMHKEWRWRQLFTSASPSFRPTWRSCLLTISRKSLHREGQKLVAFWIQALIALLVVGRELKHFQIWSVWGGSQPLRLTWRQKPAQRIKIIKQQNRQLWIFNMVV